MEKQPTKNRVDQQRRKWEVFDTNAKQQVNMIAHEFLWRKNRSNPTRFTPSPWVTPSPLSPQPELVQAAPPGTSPWKGGPHL